MTCQRCPHLVSTASTSPSRPSTAMTWLHCMQVYPACSSPGGLYYVDFAFPLLYMCQKGEWDGQSYSLKVNDPYRRGQIRELPDGRLSYTRR
jgi:hypothetical protein